MRISMALCLLALVAPGATAQRVELGVFAGYNEPFDQGDASDDIMGGVRARLPLGDLLKLEPMVTWIDMDREPYLVRNVPQEVSTWGIVSGSMNLTVGRDFGRRGYKPYATAGIGYYLLRKDEAPNQERFGINLGLGLMVLVKPDLSLDVSGRAERISLESGAERGMLNLRVGINYHLGDL